MQPCRHQAGGMCAWCHSLCAVRSWPSAHMHLQTRQPLPVQPLGDAGRGEWAHGRVAIGLSFQLSLPTRTIHIIRTQIGRFQVYIAWRTFCGESTRGTYHLGPVHFLVINFPTTH